LLVQKQAKTDEASQPYPPSETPTAMIGESGKRFFMCSMTADKSSVFAAQ